jgi:uncharacterized protein (DUF362 family)
MGELTRRELLKRAAVGGLAAAAAKVGIEPGSAQAAGEPAKSKIVIAKDASVLDKENNIKQAVVEKMLGKAIAKQQGTKTAKEAWQKLFKPGDIVGIKVNCLFKNGASTHPEVTFAVVEGLKMAGVKPENIIIWDRSSKDLRMSSYTINKEGGPQVVADDGDWGREVKNGSINGKISKILDKITALVNVPILKDHGMAGVTVAMKNHYGSIHNPGDYHGNHCDPYLADLNAIPEIKDKTRLVVVDAIRPVADGGPGLRSPECAWNYYSLIVGTDFVATDKIGWDIIEARRKEMGIPSLADAGRAPKWIATAAKLGLGTDDPNKIDIIRV